MIYRGCAFRKAFGLYCPGCGGLRAFRHFLHGEFIKSFLCHPAVDLFAVVLIVYIICIAFPALRPKPRHGYLFAAVILLNWFIRNALLLFGIEIPG